MGHIQVIVQFLTPILPEQFGDMGPVLGCFPAFQKIGQGGLAKRPLPCVPHFLLGCDLQVFISFAPELQPDCILIKEKIAHPEHSFHLGKIFYNL